ncbi:MAG: hypothetical protein CM1200mP26_22200 [Acidimicrobiales bacterium]|nr:MAG: hypothetical protein CM1200mP26_22200 [Acidimicrobiales bacterium]
MVETAEGAEPLTIEQLVESCDRAGLMRQKVPEQLVVQTAVPRNATMKILKYELKEALAEVPWPRRPPVQRPMKLPGRRSRKAATPSAASSVAASIAWVEPRASMQASSPSRSNGPTRP